jgi:hypothetical protein
VKILFIGKDEVDLFETLMNSETSRIILRFYEPRRYSCGVLISVSSLGIALSLVSELRWYVRRYMDEVLFEIQEGIFATYSLAREVYERDIRMNGEGIRRSLYRVRGGQIHRMTYSGPDASVQPSEGWSSTDEVLEVWSLEKETADTYDATDAVDEPGENH